MAKKEPVPLLFQLLEKKPRRGDTVRAQIVESAIEVIATQGIENASFDNIGKKLKMRRSHVAYYFRTREELLDLVLSYITEMTQGLTRYLMEEQEDPREKLMGIVNAAFYWATEYPNHISTYLVFYSICGREKKYQTAFREIRENGLKRIIETLDKIMEQSPEKRAKIALAIQALTLGAIFESVAKGYLTDRKYMGELKESVKEEILHMVNTY